MVPCLASEWTNSEDGKTWTFTIREGVKFSNGNDMTPELVKASLERTIEMSNRVPEFFDITSIEVDGQNVIFNLNEQMQIWQDVLQTRFPDHGYKY